MGGTTPQGGHRTAAGQATAAVVPSAGPGGAAPADRLERGLGAARPWLRAALTAALLLTFLVLGAGLAAGAESMYLVSRYVGQAQADRMAVTSGLLTLVGAGALLARHRRPVLVAGAVGALTVASLFVAGATNGYELAIAAALLAVAAARPPRTTWLVTAAVVVPVLVTARTAPRARLLGALAAGDPPGGGDAVTPLRLPGVLGTVLPPSWVVTAVPVVVAALLGVALGTLVRTARERAAALAEAAAARAAEHEQRTRWLQADERARVAREMHDVIAHSLTVMVALGGGAAAALDRSPEQARRALDELVTTGRGALDDVRRILGVLHGPGEAAGDPTGPGPDGPGPHAASVDRATTPGAPGGPTGADDVDDVPMAPQPGLDDLDALVARFRTAGLPVRTSGLALTGLATDRATDRATDATEAGRTDVVPTDADAVTGDAGTTDAGTTDGDRAPALDATVQLAVYRIVQESLTNTLRHAPGTTAVDVAVRRQGDAVEVVVEDRGPGPDAVVRPTGGSGRGVAGMTGRVAAFGGTLEAGPAGPGWRVRAVLPGTTDRPAATADTDATDDRTGDRPGDARPATEGEA